MRNIQYFSKYICCNYYFMSKIIKLKIFFILNYIILYNIYTPIDSEWIGKANT